MSFDARWIFSTGLAKPIRAPQGTRARIVAAIERTEKALGLVATQYLDNPAHWDLTAQRRGWPDIKDDDVLCRIVTEHNAAVRQFQDAIDRGAGKAPTNNVETIAPEDAAAFWHGLDILEVPPHRWSREFFVERMEHAYAVMRGEKHEGEFFDAKKLTPSQAAAVVSIFGAWLDRHDMRLAVPDGHDFLASSYDGGYDWCDKCGKAMLPDDGAACRKRKCPLAAKARE